VGKTEGGGGAAGDGGGFLRIARGAAVRKALKAGSGENLEERRGRQGIFDGGAFRRGCLKKEGPLTGASRRPGENLFDGIPRRIFPEEDRE